MEDYTDSVLQGILTLYSDTLKYASLHLGGVINFTHIKKSTVVAEIIKRWGNCAIEEVEMTSLKEEDRVK